MLAASTVIISLPGKVFCRFCDAVSLLFQPKMPKYNQK
jgi:hypothetical protein